MSFLILIFSIVTHDRFSKSFLSTCPHGLLTCWV